MTLVNDKFMKKLNPEEEFCATYLLTLLFRAYHYASSAKQIQQAPIPEDTERIESILEARKRTLIREEAILGFLQRSFFEFIGHKGGANALPDAFWETNFKNYSEYREKRIENPSPDNKFIPILPHVFEEQDSEYQIKLIEEAERIKDNP